MSSSLDRLSQLPTPGQRALLDECLDAGADPIELVRACAALSDPWPLSHVLGALRARGRSGEAGPALGELLAGGDPLAVRQALRALPPRDSPPALVRAVAEACAALPLERVEALGLALQWLGEAAPRERRRLHEAAAERCRAAAAEGGAPDEGALLLAPGAALRALGAEGGGALGAALEAFAGRVLRTLGRGPRSLSQANAEELLARRVYEGRGHFLFELLQNADDARAGEVTLAVRGGELSLSHDGVPFDCRDVLGVLSVGLSTKQEGDIGLFGAGFKSVYAVTERPRVYSGPYRFEIAGMSRPRPIAAPEGLPPGLTCFALPLDRGDDEAELLDEALALPPELLLTLRHVRRLVVEGGDGVRRALGRVDEGAVVTLLDEGRGEPRRFVGARGGDAAPVLVALELDEGGLPRAPAPGRPSVYCYLPTREESGLPLLLHGAFDVPLDRERLRRDSARNRQALVAAGALLGRLVEGLDGPRAEAALSLLSGARPSPFFAELLETARQHLGDVPLFLAADGRRVPATRARRVAPTLAPVVAGLPLDDEGRAALAPLAPELDAAAAWLGAAAFGPADLLALLERRLRGVSEGARAPEPWLAEGAAALAAELGRLEGGEARRRDGLPWLVAEGGGCHRASALRLATRAQAALYGGARPLRVEASEGGPWASVGVRRLDEREIVADLHDATRRAAMLRRPDALLDYLAGLGPALLAGLGALPIVPGEAGGFSPLLGEGALWLWPPGEIGAWLASAPRPPMVAPATQAAHGALLRALGGRELGVSELFGWLSEGPPLPLEQARALTAVAERSWRSWTPRQTEAALRAPVFVDVEGRLRPVEGPGGALMPADDAIVALAPGLPWLEAEERRLGLLAATPRLGAAALVQSLAGEGPLFDEWPDLDPVLAYLGPRVGEVPGALREALARAARWPGTDGARRPLRELSRPSSDPALERFYASTGLRPRLEAGALRLAELLGLADRLAPGGLDALVDDLAEGRVDPAHPELPSLLARGATVLGAAALERLSGVALFLADDGARRPLAPWGVQRSSPRPCYRAHAPFRRLLALGSAPLLAEGEEARWGPALLDRVAGPPAGPEVWVEALANDPSLAGVDAALVARATLFDAGARRELEPFRSRLDARPLWRGGDGALRPASSLALPDELAELLGEPWEGLLPAEGVLDPRERSEAEALRAFFSFRPALAFVAEQVRAQARFGRTLGEQPPLLGRAERVATLRARSQGADPLRVGVDATGALTSAELWDADADEQLLAAGLALETRLAHPALVAALPPGTFAPLPPARLLEALAPALRERGSIDDGRFDEGRRAALYRWLERRSAAVEADEQARGLLGKLHAFATEDGGRRCPRELLAAPSFEALGLPGRPAPEVPAAVRAWLARAYRLDDAALGPLLDALLDAAAGAAESGDGGRAARLARALSDALTPPPGARPDEHEARVERALRAQRASRRLRVPTGDGAFVRPRALLLAPPEERSLIDRFHPSPPPAPAPHLEPDALAPLLRRLGARDRLGADELATLMAPGGSLPGFEASLARARYVALALGAEPSLRQRLELDRAAWVPTADGRFEPPSALFWPEPGLEELLGPRPDLLPHPLFARTVPASFGRRMRFRRPADASLDDVLRPLADGVAAPPETLRWLEDALQAGALEPPALRQALGPRRVFLDTQGDVHAFAELGTGRDARPVWADHERWPRLASALRLDRRPAPSAVAPSAPDATATPRRPAPAAAAEGPDASTFPGESAPKQSLWQRWFGAPAKPVVAPTEPAARAPTRAEARPPARPGATVGSAEAPPARPGATGGSAEAPPAQAERRARHEAWYRPSDAIRPQLEGAGGWSESRRQRPRYGFALAPGKLPPPYLYAARTVAERFHAPTQRWERGGLPAEWSTPGARALSRVQFRGRAPAGVVVLPVPMYATLEALDVDGAPQEAVLGADGRWMVALAEAAEIGFEVALREAPRFHDGPLELGPEAEPLLAPTAPEDELPRELAGLVDELLASPLSAMARALRVRDFIRERYRYDPSYLEDERVGRWLSRVTQGSGNVHLAALHVGRAGRHLGAGVCYELNALACELLRRVGVPAALASGWALSGEQVDEPDHLWALALVPSDLGPRLLPLDASSTRNGTPLRVAERPRGPFRAQPPPAHAPLPPPPSWAAQQPRGAAAGAQPPLGELARVARYLARQQGERAPDEGTLRRRLQALLDDPGERRRLLALLRGEP
ncbi:MAG TPA: transglutaminase domain-containing protein [Polyangiaceae bacterium]|nr:transglutaminase domain-containing protein [Polyangiaceae bacterium]